MTNSAPLTVVSHFRPAEALATAVVLFGALGLALTQFLPALSIASWVALLLACLIAGALAAAVPRPAPAGTHGGRGGWSAALALLALFIPAFWYTFTSVRMQLAAHGYFHTAYILQILHSFTPPENVTLPGTPANYYWYAHALWAALARLANGPPPLVTAVFLLAVMLATLGLLWQIGGILLPQEGRPAVRGALAIFALFGMNLFGLLHTFYFALRGTAVFPPGVPRPTPLFGDGRLNILLTNYLGITGFPLGVLCFVFVLLVVARLFARQARGQDLLLGLLAIFAALALHATSGLFLATAVPLALALTYVSAAARDGKLFDLPWHRAQAAGAAAVLRTQPGWATAILISGLLLAALALRFLLGAATALSTPPSFELVSLYQAQSVFSMVYPLLPFFLWAAVHAFREGTKLPVFLSILTLIGLAMGYFLRVESNQYKFIFLGSIAMSLLCTWPIWHFLFRPGPSASKLGRATAVLMLGLAALNIFALGLSQAENPFVQNQNFVNDGAHVVARAALSGVPEPEVPLAWTRGLPYPDSDLAYADAFQWARTHTPANALIVAPLLHKDHSALPLLSERLPYVVDGDFYNHGHDDYAQRIAQVTAVYDAGAETAVRAAALTAIAAALPGRPTYLLYPHDLPPLPQGFGGTAVFVGRAGTLYRLAEA